MRDPFGGVRQSVEWPAQPIVRPAVLPVAMIGLTVATFEPVVGFCHSTVVMSDGVVGTAQPIVLLCRTIDGVRQTMNGVHHRPFVVRQAKVSTFQAIVGLRQAIVGLCQATSGLRQRIDRMRHSVVGMRRPRGTHVAVAGHAWLSGQPHLTEPSNCDGAPVCQRGARTESHCSNCSLYIYPLKSAEMRGATFCAHREETLMR